MMISKELMSEVLGYVIEKVKSIMDEKVYFNNEDNGDYISIHELAHKCVLYFYNDYIFDISAYEIKVTKIIAFKEPEEVYLDSWMDIPYDINKTFKACQWILDNE